MTLKIVDHDSNKMWYQGNISRLSVSGPKEPDENVSEGRPENHERGNPVFVDFTKESTVFYSILCTLENGSEVLVAFSKGRAYILNDIGKTIDSIG